jgi:hypothetical protein
MGIPLGDSKGLQRIAPISLKILVPMTTLAAIGSLYREISLPSMELVVVTIMVCYFSIGQG